jgi:AraC-like DNA-binding protein
MFTDTILIIINATCILSLLIMLIVLATATRMKGGAGFAALIVVTTTVPTYLLNLMRDMSSPEYYRLTAYIACFINVLCIPALWFFVHRQYDKSFRFTLRTSLHLVPALVSSTTFIVCYSLMTDAQLAETMRLMENGGEDFPTLVNDIIIATQLVVYFPMMLRYIYRRKKYLKDNFTDSDYFTLKWTQSFITVFFGLFVVVFAAYAINPRTDVWLIPILNVLGMAYLMYVVICHSTETYLSRLPADVSKPADGNGGATSKMSENQMKDICDRIAQYLQASKSYINPGLSINTLSSESGIHHRNISIAINGYLHKNFFDLVNEMRVEEAKRLLRALNPEYSTDSVFSECGFSSRSSYYTTFKKFERTTPAQWRKSNT